MMYDIPSQRKTREQRKDQMFELLQHRNSWLTLKVMARAMGLHVTPYLRAIAGELVREGMVERRFWDNAYGTQTGVYHIAPEFEIPGE